MFFLMNVLNIKNRSIFMKKHALTVNLFSSADLEASAKISMTVVDVNSNRNDLTPSPSTACHRQRRVTVTYFIS